MQQPVNALVESLHTAAPGVGYALGTAVAALASPRAAYAVAALGALAALLLAGPWPGLRRPRTARSPPQVQGRLHGAPFTGLLVRAVMRSCHDTDSAPRT